MAAQKVLIIDDSKLMRLQVREMLPGNMEIVEAVDGADGFEKIHQEQPSLIIMDCFMPKMNGWQVVNKMLSFPELHKVPVVLMSGREEDVQENAGELFDHFEFLAKPFDKTKLITAIKAALAKAKNRRAPVVDEVANETTTMAANVALDATTLLQKLQSEVQDLRQQNANMRAEMKQMKQQMAQITKVVKQNLTHA